MQRNTLIYILAYNSTLKILKNLDIFLSKEMLKFLELNHFVSILILYCLKFLHLKGNSIRRKLFKMITFVLPINH